MGSILPLLIVCGIGIVASATYMVITLIRHYRHHRHSTEYYELLEDGTLVVCSNYRSYLDY